MTSSQECGNDGSEERRVEERRRRRWGKSNLYLRLLLHFLLLFLLRERESSRTFFSRNQSISARHPLKSVLLLAASRVPVIDLIEERSSFHEICTNRGEREREYRKRAFPNLVFRNAFPGTFAPQFNFDFAAGASSAAAVIHFALSSGRKSGVGLLISSKVKVITSKFHFTDCSSKKLFY